MAGRKKINPLDKKYRVCIYLTGNELICILDMPNNKMYDLISESAKLPTEKLNKDIANYIKP